MYGINLLLLLAASGQLGEQAVDVAGQGLIEPVWKKNVTFMASVDGVGTLPVDPASATARIVQDGSTRITTAGDPRETL